MASRTIYSNIILRVALILITALAAVWLVLIIHQLSLFAIFMLLLLWQGYALARSLNEVNRRIAFFFDAIRNEDTTLTFPDTGNASMNELSRSMNRLNELIRDAKTQIRSQEQYYETILEHAATGLLSYDERGNILLANTAVRHLLHCEPLTHISQLERIEQGLSIVFEQMAHTENKLINISNERGSLQLLLRATTMILKNKKIILLSVQDIQNELDEKETTSWIKLTRVLTHEIMNSIAPITSLSETLAGYYLGEDGPRSPEDLNEQMIANTIKGLTVIQERGKGLVNFVDAYRKLTHLPKPECKQVNLHEFLEKVQFLILSDPTFQGVALNVIPIENPITLFIDENLFSQVIINLVHNSLQAINGRDNGEITIHAFMNASGSTTLNIIDNGPGIPPEILDQIFVPFFTTRENGSGIGLSLSRQIIRLHGGNLQVVSHQGVETIFSIEI